MQRPITRGAAANAGLIFHVFVMDSTSTTGAGKASIAFSSFTCYYIRNGEAISGAITPQDITTIGTYAAPTANTNIRIKAVDNTNMIGVYEVQLHLDWVNTTNTCQSLTIYLSASGAAVLPIQIPLIGFNQQDGVRAGLTALPNAAADAAGGLPISDAGGLDLDARLDAAVSSRMATYTQPTGFLAATFPGGTIANTTNITAGTITTVGTLTTYTGNTPQTGDAYAIVNSGTFGNAAIKGYVDDIGTAGAGLTAVPWNAAWDAEVQSEVDDALIAQRLDELLNADSDIDGAAPPTVGSVFHELMTKTAGSFTYDQTTDSLEAIRDRGDAAWTTATGFSTHSAADVWAVATRVLTAGTNIVLAKGVGVTGFNDLSATNVEDAVWDAVMASHLDSGSTGAALNAAGAAGDPWTTTLPGAYGAGTAGFILGTNLNATVSSRSSHSAADVWAVGARTITGTVTLADGAHGGAAAVLTLSRIIVSSATPNEPAVKLTGNNIGAALLVTGGVQAHGIEVYGGATSGDAVNISATNGHALFASAGGDNQAIHASSGVGSNCAAVIFVGDGTAAGLEVQGGTGIAAPALLLQSNAASGNGDGLKTVAAGTGTGIRGSIVGNITGNLSGSIGSVGSGGITSASFGAGAIDAAAIADGAIDAATFASGAFGAVWTTAMTESYAADGVEPTPAQSLYAIQQSIIEFSIAGTTLTVKKLDGLATALTCTLDSATDPTSRTRAT